MSVSLSSRTDTLHLSIGPTGCRVTAPDGIAFDRLRCDAFRSGDFAIDVAGWIDRWADAHRLVDLLDDRGTSLWWFVRLHMVFYFVDLLRDVQALSTVVDMAGSRTLRIDGADAHWGRVARVVARERALTLALSDGADPSRLRRWRARTADTAALVARAAAAVPRRLRRPRDASVAALLYSVCKRVTLDAQVRYLEPTYEPILEELSRRGLAPLKLSAPSVYGWRHEMRWLRLGDRDAIPIELSLLAWMGRTSLRPLDGAQRDLEQRLASFVEEVRHEGASWQGRDVSREVAEFVTATLAPRVRRGAKHTRFFEVLLGQAPPGVLLVSHEYSGLAMSAIAAARRLGIAVVGVQHGVIWRGHPGYAMPKERAETMSKPDVICVFGEFDRELLLRHGVYRPEEIAVTGSPRFDLIANRPPELTRPALLERLGLPPTAAAVLLSSTGESQLLSRRLSHMLRASAEPVSVIVKLHPLVEQDPAAWDDLTRSSGPAQVRVVGEQIDLYDLLRLVDVHMSMNSTVLSEAAAFGRPNILFLTDLAADTVEYVSRSVAVRAEDYDSLAEAVEDVLHGSAAARLHAGRERFVAEHFHRLDGRATARAAEVVERLLGCGPAHRR